MRRIKVLLVDDHLSILTSLRYMLESAEDVQVVGMASNGLEAVEQAGKHCPDVTVMDISMPLMDGIEATRQIKKLCANTRVTMLSIFDNPRYVERALDVGASGFVLKESIGKDLLAAIRALFAGKRYFSQKIAAIARQYPARGGQESEPG